jgi:hypothetical protein
MFDVLLAAALREWPATLSMKVQSFEHCYLVEGLTELQDQISRRWIGHELEVLMSNLHWAICATVHHGFAQTGRVVPSLLDRDIIRYKFEDDLNLILHDRLNWRAADVRLIETYFASGRRRPVRPARQRRRRKAR